MYPLIYIWWQSIVDLLTWYWVLIPYRTFQFLCQRPLPRQPVPNRFQCRSSTRLQRSLCHTSWGSAEVESSHSGYLKKLVSETGAVEMPVVPEFIAFPTLFRARSNRHHNLLIKLKWVSFWNEKVNWHQFDIDKTDPFLDTVLKFLKQILVPNNWEYNSCFRGGNH